MMRVDEFDLATPRREAAMFYGLFLRGHSIDRLRQDIDVPKAVLQKWRNAHRYEPSFRDSLTRIYTYRKMVLAIFDELILGARNKSHLQ